MQTGTQQRSWDHWILGKQIIDSGQARPDHVRADRTGISTRAPATRAGRHGQARLEAVARPGARPAVPAGALLPVAPLLGLRRRLPHRSDDALDRRRPLVHGRRGADLGAQRPGTNYNLKMWEAPDTVTTTLEFPNNFMAAYLGTYVSRVDDGGLEFRGELGHAEDRSRAAGVLRDDAAYARRHARRRSRTSVIRSNGDGIASRTCRTGSTASAAASSRTRTSASRTRRRGRRTSPTPRSAPAPGEVEQRDRGRSKS